jgi:hypothetical protein
LKLLTHPIEREELQQMSAKMFGNLVKAVVDIEREIMAIDAELHVDIAEFLVENGSTQNNLWGINIYQDMTGDNWLEFDSVINLKPQIGNLSRDIGDPVIKEKVKSVVKKFINL